jgi:alpha-L-arabinofuranosidase
MNMYKVLIISGMFLAMAVNAANPKPGDEYKGVKLDKTQHAVQAVLPLTVTVDENKVIKPWSSLMLGYNHNWHWANHTITDQKDKKSLKVSAEYLKLVKGAKLPLNRMAGSESQHFLWKKTIGPIEKRSPMKLVGWRKIAEISRAGVVEWIKSVILIDPDAEFVFVFNMDRDSVQNAADLVEFLTGDPAKNPGGGVNWAAKRVEYGLKNPVKVKAWELGNELDWHSTTFPLPSVYTKKCQEIITAVRKIAPEARFAALAATAPWSRKPARTKKIPWKNTKTPGGWKIWHRQVLKDLAKDIDYLAFHPYYHGMRIIALERYMDPISKDIKEITGSNRIKLFISEHAMWPPRLKNKPWGASWYRTHGLIGCLATAEWINRMYSRKDVAIMTYHCFCGGPWGAIYRDKKSQKLYTTGILDMFNLLSSAGGKDIVETTAVGKLADVKRRDLTFTVSAITTQEGLVLILNNRDPKTKRVVSFDFKGKYSLRQSEVFSAPSLHSYDTVSSKPIKITKKAWNLKTPFKQYTVPAKSLVILRLKKIEK